MLKSELYSIDIVENKFVPKNKIYLVNHNGVGIKPFMYGFDVGLANEVGIGRYILVNNTYKFIFRIEKDFDKALNLCINILENRIQKIIDNGEKKWEVLMDEFITDLKMK